jgi:hypothetical protein
MNPDQLIQLLMQIIGGQGNPNPGAPIGVQMTDMAAKFLMPEGPGREMLVQMIGPEVNKAMFGEGPFAGYGGINSQWNMASRLTQYHQERLVKRFKDSAKIEVQQATENQYLDLMSQKMGVTGGREALTEAQRQQLVAGESTDWRYLMMRGANALTMPEQISYGVRDLMPSQGYFMGAGVGGGNQFIDSNKRMEDYMLGRMKYDPQSGSYKPVEGREGIDPKTGRRYQMADPLAKMLTDDFMNSGYLYGGLNSTDIKSLTSEMGRRGEIKVDTNERWDKTEGGQADRIKSQIQETSRAVSSIRDIIKGDIPEVLRQLEGAFGGDSLSIMKVKGAARSVQQYRQLAESTGTNITDMIQYTQATNMIARQTAGYTIGGDAGLSVSAQMSILPQGDMRGLDSAAYARTVAERTTGARMSQTSLMVSGAIGLLQGQGASEAAIEAFKAKVTSGGEKVSSESIARWSTEALGKDVSEAEIISTSRGRMARDIMTSDPTGQRAANANLKKIQMDRRSDTIRSYLNITNQEQLEALKGMNTREMREYLVKNDMLKGNPGREAGLGELGTELDVQARQYGFEGGEEQQAAYWRNMKKSEVYQDVSKAKAEFAEAFQFGGGGVAGVLRDLSARNLTDVDFKKGLDKFLNVINNSKIIDVSRKNLITSMMQKDSLGMKAMTKVLASRGANDPYFDKVNEIVNKEMADSIQYAIDDPDATQESVDERQRNMETTAKKKIAEYEKSFEGQIVGKAGKSWDILTATEKRAAMKKQITERATELLKDSSLDSGTKAKLKKLKETGGADLEDEKDRVKFMGEGDSGEKFKRLFFGEEEYKDTDGKMKKRVKDEAGAELFAKGVPTTIIEKMDLILKAITNFGKSGANTGSNELPFPFNKLF